MVLKIKRAFPGTLFSAIYLFVVFSRDSVQLGSSRDLCFLLGSRYPTLGFLFPETLECSNDKVLEACWRPLELGLQL